MVLRSLDTKVLHLCDRIIMPEATRISWIQEKRNLELHPFKGDRASKEGLCMMRLMTAAVLVIPYDFISLTGSDIESCVSEGRRGSNKVQYGLYVEM